MNQVQKIKRQKGNYLLSIGIGILVAAILTVWGMPKVSDYLVEGQIPSVSEEVQKYIARVTVMNQGSGTTPYTGLTQDAFARAVRGGALQVGDVAGEGTTSTDVRHGLGGGAGGTVTVSNTGSAFALTFKSVNQAACPGLATSLSRSADDISINGKTVKVTDSNKTVTTGYVASNAQAQCLDGDANEFVFTVR